MLAIKVILLISMTLGCSFGQDTPASSAPNLVKTFRSFDKNGDNILSKREFKKGMIALKKNLGENERLSRSDINQAFNSLDESKDRKLSFDEFKNVMRMTQSRGNLGFWATAAVLKLIMDDLRDNTCSICFLD